MGGAEEFELALPFTINKLFRPAVGPLPVLGLRDFVADSLELAARTLQLDRNIVEDVQQLKDIFPDLVSLDQYTQFLLVDIDPGAVCVLKLALVEQDTLRVSIHAERQNDVFAEVLRWFFWVFARGG